MANLTYCRSISIIELNQTIMKTKTFLLLCLFLGFGLTMLSAQGNSQNSDNRATQERFEGDSWIPIVCNGVTIDELLLTGEYHQIQFVNNGNWQWIIAQVKFNGVSIGTNETFRNNELDKYKILTTDANGFPTEANLTVKIHLMGNMGSRYTCYLACHVTEGAFDWTIIKSACDFE
jgi:hypothetical protein